MSDAIPPAEARHMRRAGLSEDQRARVLARVAECLARIHREHPMAVAAPTVTFDLAGTAAGQYRRTRHPGRPDGHQLRFNPYLLARHFDDSLANTLPHEVAHYAVAVLFRARRTRAHGSEWQSLMQLLGASPSVTHNYDTSDLATRRQRRWRYRCECREHELSTTRHHRAQGGTMYLCQQCGQALRPLGPDRIGAD